jgi:protein involved in polysaccharide export with SLBB domain
VPQRWDNDNVIGMFGGVMETANFEFVSGDSLSTLVAMSMGFRPEADATRALLTRLSPDGSSMDSVHLDAKAIVERRAPDIALRPGDRLIVPILPVLAANFRVTVEGEVRMPGMYPITRTGTRVSDVIRLAGGLTSEANLSGATLYRTRISETNPVRDMERERLFSLRSSLPVQDTSYYHVETALRIMGEVVALDLPGLLLRGDSTCDVMVRPRDRVIIPAKQRTVYVFGQVLAPGHVMFVEGQPHRYYVEKAGGYTNDARSGDVKVIKGGTRAWLDPGETKVEDGDMIWVPKEPSYPFSYYITTWSQVAAILLSIATVVLLIKTL